MDTSELQGSGLVLTRPDLAPVQRVLRLRPWLGADTVLALLPSGNCLGKVSLALPQGGAGWGGL